MKCPKCKKEMVVVNSDFSFDNRKPQNKRYKRTVYHCKEDDIWINLEVPSDN